MKKGCLLFTMLVIASLLLSTDSAYFFTNNFYNSYSFNFPVGYWRLESGHLEQIQDLRGYYTRVVPNLVLGKYLMVADGNYCSIDCKYPLLSSSSKFVADYSFVQMYWQTRGIENSMSVLTFDNQQKKVYPVNVDLVSGNESPDLDVDPNSFYYQGCSHFLNDKSSFYDFTADRGVAKTWITGKERALNCHVPVELTGLQRILVSTQEFFICADAKSYLSDHITYFIELRESDITDTLRVKGGYTWPQAFGYWICATIYASNPNSEQSPGYDKRKEFFKLHRISSITQQRLFGECFKDLEATDTGASIDSKFMAQGIYSPGIIFAYNAETKQYIELNTGEGDSEILLIQDGTMYWREFDEIYKAPITDKGLGQKTLVVKGPPVPDIHWMFISEEGDGK